MDTDNVETVTLCWLVVDLQGRHWQQLPSGWWCSQSNLSVWFGTTQHTTLRSSPSYMRGVATLFTFSLIVVLKCLNLNLRDDFNVNLLSIFRIYFLSYIKDLHTNWNLRNMDLFHCSDLFVHFKSWQRMCMDLIRSLKICKFKKAGGQAGRGWRQARSAVSLSQISIINIHKKSHSHFTSWLCNAFSSWAECLN